MFYYLVDLFNLKSISGIGLFEYISFRSTLAFIASLFFSFFYGKKIIHYLRKKQIGESIRELGLEGQNLKSGTPTMGGIIIIFSTIISTLLFSKFLNVYIILLIISTLWMGIIGFLDDYIKVFKKNKNGLKGKFKIAGQIGLGIIVSLTMYLSSDIKIKEKKLQNGQTFEKHDDNLHFESNEFKTTIPFVKDNEFNYSDILPDNLKDYTWILFVIISIFIITSVSNGANLTDGIDGLATGISAIQVLVLISLAWISGNIVFSDYLNIVYIPNSGEMVVFCAALLGSLIGFLWYNTFPAQVFMGDTGSLTIGGIIAVIAILLRKELLLPLISIIFLIENLSVVMQVSYFKYTKRRFGIGKRIFKMAPLHHHFQKLGIHESKITIRFWIIGLFFAVISIITLKIR